MKLQGLGILFALIVLPVILVLTYYIQLQVDTINLQNQYDTKLLDATHDAMSSFEINTANEDLSTVSDSLRTIIDASTNVFFNSLATNFGMSNASKSYVEPYVPAILYTLYDGYYISAPTKVPTVLTDPDGNAVSVGDIGVQKSGNDYTYQVIHTTQEQEDNCSECASGSSTHIRYSIYSGAEFNWNPYYLKYEDTGDDYGQLLYLKGDNLYTTNIDKAEFKTKNVLKTYMPYSARYIHENGDDRIDINVIYTLDNYVTIEGTINNVYYSKSGYLLPKNLDMDINGDRELLSYNQEDAQSFIENNQNPPITLNLYTTSDEQITTIEAGDNRTYNELSDELIRNKEILQNARNFKVNGDLGVNAFIDLYRDTYGDDLDAIIESCNDRINNIQYELDKKSAIEYYVKGKIFSTWVYENLGEIEERDLVEISGQNYKSVNGHEEVTYNFEESDRKIFEVTGSTQNGFIEIAQDSSFYNHKLNVIRNSIQYNLNSAMSTYNNSSSRTADYSMPVMSNIEWEKILNNVSIVSFMQGVNCGLKSYNNYVIVSSTNNELAIQPNDIYYVEKEQFNNETAEYHRIDCKKFLENSNTNEYIAFPSKEVKYDKIYDKSNSFLPYQYDYRNFACYDCINDGNYEKVNIFDINSIDEEYRDRAIDLQRAYYIGVAKCKNNLYKMNGVQNSKGFEIIYDSERGIYGTSSLPISEIKALEIVFGTIRTTASDDIIRCKIEYNNEEITEEDSYSINANSSGNSTVVANINNNNNTFKLDWNRLKFENDTMEIVLVDNDIKNRVKSVKVIYK